MYKNKKVVVVLPAYNAALTLEKTYNEIPFDIVDEVILCDDASRDNTVDLARKIGIQHVIEHQKNKGYGGNQKSLYNMYPVVLGSRILGKGARKGGMPLYKYIANRFLTFTQNLLINYKLSEYHTGYRAFSKEVLQKIKFNSNSDDFVFDNEMLSQIIYAGFDIGEVTCPTKYFEEASSINFRRSAKYGFGVLRVSIVHFFCKLGLGKSKLY